MLVLPLTLSCTICFDHESFLRQVSPTVRPFISVQTKLDRFADYFASIQVNYLFHRVFLNSFFWFLDWMRLRGLMNFWLIILNILLTRWLLVLIGSLKLNLTQMIPSFLLLRVFVILLVLLMKTCLIKISLLLVLLCLHVAVPEFSAHATVSSSSSQSSG